MISIGLLSAFLAVFAWSIYNIACKKAGPHIGSYKLSLIVIAAGIIPMLIALLISGISWPGTYQLLASIISGIFLFGGVFFYFKAIESQQLTSIVAFGEVQPAILTIFGVFVLSEAVTTLDIFAIILIFAGGFFVISTEGLKINKKLVPALLANVSWTVYWLFLSEAEANTSGFTLQVAVSRVIALILVLFLLYFSAGQKDQGFKPKTSNKIPYLMLALGVIGGLFDGLGDTIFSFTLHSNIVAVGGAVTALTPIIVSILSYFIFKDRLTKVQTIGVVIMVVGALALSLG